MWVLLFRRGWKGPADRLIAVVGAGISVAIAGRRRLQVVHGSSQAGFPAEVGHQKG